VAFRARAWDLARQIPSGRVIGYGQLAAALGSARAARQVGWAMAALPADTDVPWHRVVRSSGHLAMQGDPGRPLLQRFLLEREGVTFVGDRVDMGRYGWQP
jgi:methylated-DNA-protein-cysteine methyltransferase-like protein